MYQMNSFDRYKTNGDTHTHLSFSGGKYFIDDSNYKLFYKEYYDLLQKEAPLYMIEKIHKSKFAFFIDIELPKKIYSPTIDIIDSVNEIINKTKTVLMNAQQTPNENNTEHILSRRNNKYHINYPKFIVDNKIAIALVNELIELLGPDSIQLIDKSVYNTGLRMLGSLKSPADTEKERALYGNEFELVYKILKYDTIVQTKDLDFDLFSKTIVRVSSRTKLTSVKAEYKAVPKAKPKMTIVESSDQSIVEEMVGLLNWVYNESRGILKEPFEIEKIALGKSVHGTNFYVNIKNKHCYFKDRMHRRESSPIYIEIGINGMYLKCYDNECAYKKFPHNNEGFILPPDFETDYPTIYNKIHCFYKTDLNLDLNTIKLMERSLSCTHYSIAKASFHIYKDIFRVDDIKNTEWYKFNGISWKKTFEMNMLISDDIPRYYNSIKVVDSDNSKDIVEFKEKEESSERNDIINGIISKLENSSFKSCIMKELVHLFKMSDPDFTSRLDANQYLIGFENGVFDLKENSFRAGTPLDYITFSTGYDYIPYDPESEHVQAINVFLRQIITDNSVFEYTMKILGRSLLGVPDEKFYIFTGSGSNGKSTLIEFIEHALGDYTTGVDTTLLTNNKTAGSSATPDIIRIKGKRLVSFAETEKGDVLKTGLIKMFSGGDSIIARELYKAPVSFKSQASMIMCCNDLPLIKSMDGGIARRLRIVDFNSKFCTNPSGKNEFKIDYTMREKLLLWRPYFMGILLHWYQVYDQELHQNGFIEEPEAVLLATNKFKQDNDIFAEYMTECLVESSHSIKFKTIHDHFASWWGMNNSSVKIPTKKDFQKALDAKFTRQNTMYNIELVQTDEQIDDY